MPEIHLENVSKWYTEEKRTMYAVKEVNFTVEQGEFVFLIGSSGAGKSTLLKLIGGELTPDEGVVYLDSANIARLKSRLAARKALGIVGLPGVEGCYPAELSIGECRRVELARALINSPPILLLDELTANLDDDNIWDLMHLLNELNSRGTTIIMATHASQYVNIMRRRVVTLVDGRLVGDVKNGKYGDIV